MTAPRCAVVTGSASGIGQATHRLLSKQFDEVIGVDLDDADVAADLGTPSGVQQAVKEIAERCPGKLHAAVCCAGVNTGAPASVLMINYFGTVALLEGLRPHLAAASRSAAVAMASYALGYGPSDRVVDACLSGDRAAAQSAAPDSYREAYSASKLAVARWVRRTAPTTEWIGAGISLNAIAPGLVRTRMVEERLADPDRAAVLRTRVPMPIGSEAEPADIAGVVGFLVDAAARFVVGQVVFVDGGADALARPDTLHHAYATTDGFTGEEA